MSTVPNPSTLNWFEIPTADLDRASAFYQTILGITLRRDTTDPKDLMCVFPVERTPERPAMTGALVQRAFQPPAGQGTLVYLNCNGRLEEVLDRVPAAGGSVTHPLTPVPGGFGHFACILDTEGNTVGLHSA
ncbi:MAG TPA: VOC family protein [Granulicella sp.]